ncbi:MAG: hypothetical protein A3G87_00095 [Omnitrophica bacterium RIFCSPLOWO2_12_FULL_50_11]|nr:MAG: hypothetical protein A3G87_00095 [Omnitrophica bacterium RIFCSPLOWO2_12_FULL_50_11]
MEFGMNVAEDFKKMTDQFRGDFQNRIAMLRGIFRDTRQLLAPVRPQLRQHTRQLLTGFRTSHKRMATELHQFLKGVMPPIRNENKRMMQEFHTQDNHRKAQCKQMHGAAQAFFKAMAHARQMHPLRGGQQTEGTAKPAGLKMRRTRKHHAPAAPAS